MTRLLLAVLASAALVSEASAQSADLDGTWARDRSACKAYLSGDLQRRNRDTASLAPFLVTTIKNGNLEMFADPVRCRISSLTATSGSSYTLSAQCQVKDYPAEKASGSASFNATGGATLRIGNPDFGPVDLVKCD